MYLEDIFQSKNRDEIYPILQECKQFLEESNGHPLLKNLPMNYNDIHKVKVRKRKRKDDFTNIFNEAFEDIPNLRQRAIFANGKASLQEAKEGEEAFYIFPIDGYKFMYSPEVSNSKEDYKNAFEVILENFDDKEVMEELLKYTYTKKNLVEGISNGSEIIIYNIPYFYAVRQSSIEDYKSLLDIDK